MRKIENKKISAVDRILGYIAEKLSLIPNLTPVNLSSERKKFFDRLQKGKEYNPQFIYDNSLNSLEVDLSSLKHLLPFVVKDGLSSSNFIYYSEQMKLETLLNLLEVGENQYSPILENRRKDLLLKLYAIRSIGTPAFTKNSLLLYGSPSKLLSRAVYDELKRQRFTSSSQKKGKIIPVEETIEKFKEAIEKLELPYQVKSTNKISSRSIIVRGDRVLINKKAEFTESEISRLLSHELGTHVFRKENGKRQPLKVFAKSQYSLIRATEEGLAVYNEVRSSPDAERMKILLLRVLAVNLALRGSFFEVFDYINGFGVSSKEAFDITLRVKRGIADTSQKGGFTKDFLYLKGYVDVKSLIDKALVSIEDLYIGKISTEELKYIKNIKEIRAPKYLPNLLLGFCKSK